MACLKAVDFDPIGQVMGTSVYPLRPPDDLPHFWPLEDQLRRPDFRLFRDKALYAARDRALTKLRSECTALGAAGVVAVDIRIGPFRDEPETLMFQVRGTAVRSRTWSSRWPCFLSGLSAQDFAALLTAGWVPVGLVVGAATLRAGGPDSVRLTARRAKPQKIEPWSGAVAFARECARSLVEEEASAAFAEGVLVTEHELRSPVTDGHRIVAATLLGTAIAPVVGHHRSIFDPPQDLDRRYWRLPTVVHLSEEPR